MRLPCSVNIAQHPFAIHDGFCFSWETQESPPVIWLVVLSIFFRRSSWPDGHNVLFRGSHLSRAEPGQGAVAHFLEQIASLKFSAQGK